MNTVLTVMVCINLGSLNLLILAATHYLIERYGRR